LHEARRNAQGAAIVLETAELQARFAVEQVELDPRVHYCTKADWLELTVRFVVGTHRIRSAKDAMGRHVVNELDRAGIGIVSATDDIVGFPAIKVRQGSAAKAGQPPGGVAAPLSQPVGAPRSANQ